MPSSLLSWFAETSASAAALAAFAALLCWRRFPVAIGPAMRHALWLLVLIKLLTPPLITAPWPNMRSIAPQPERSADALRTGPVQESAIAPPPIVLDPAPPAASARQAVASLSPAPPLKASQTPTETKPKPKPKTRPVPAEPPKRIADPPARAIATVEAIPVPVPTAISASPTEPPSRPERFTRRDAERWAFGVWIAGAVAVLGWQASALRRFGRRVRRGGCATERLETIAKETAIAMKVRPPSVVLVQGLAAPAVWCFGKPRLLIPESFEGQIDPRTWRLVLAHELAHLARRDHWVLWLEMIAAPIWWWNPLFWLVRRRLRIEADRACDARVAASWPHQRRDYAEAILEICQRLVLRSSAKTPASPQIHAHDPILSFGHSSSRLLERRLIMILHNRPIAPKLSWTGIATLAILAALAIPARSASRAQPPDADPKKSAAPAATPTAPKGAAAKTEAQPTGTTDPFVGVREPEPRKTASADAAVSTTTASNPMSSEAEAAMVEREHAKLQVRIKEAELAKARAEYESKIARLARLKNSQADKEEIQEAQLATITSHSNMMIKTTELEQAMLRRSQTERQLELAQSKPAAQPSLPVLTSRSAIASNRGSEQDAALKGLVDRVAALEAQIASLTKLLERQSAPPKSKPTSGFGGGPGSEGGSGGGAELQDAYAPQRPTALQGQPRADNSPKSVQTLESLNQDMNFPFSDPAPFQDALRYLKDESRKSSGKGKGIPFYLDKTALEDSDVNDETLVTLELEGVSIKTGLALILREIGLTYCIRDGIVIITNEDSVDEYIVPENQPTAGAALKK